MIMKDTILNKITIALNRLKIYNIFADEAYEVLKDCGTRYFNMLCAAYRLTDEEIKFIRNDQTA